MNRNVISVDIQDRWGRKNFKAADEFREIGLSVKERKSKVLKKKKPFHIEENSSKKSR